MPCPNFRSEDEVCPSRSAPGDIEGGFDGCQADKIPDPGPDLTGTGFYLPWCVFDSPETGSYHGAAMDAKSLGPIIKAWRIESDLSQQELGDLAGLNKKIVGNIERGQRVPDKLEIVRLCHALRKTPAELMVGWYRSFLEDLNELEGELLNSSKPSPRNDSGSQALSAAPGPKINQIIDRLAALMKELYQESRADAQKNFLDWLAQTGLLNSFPPPGAPRQARKRVRRKRGPAKA